MKLNFGADFCFRVFQTVQSLLKHYFLSAFNFEVVSQRSYQIFPSWPGLFQSALACYSMFWVVLLLQTTILENVPASKFIKNELHVRFYSKVGQALLQSGATLMYYKVGKVELNVGQVLQSGTGIKKWGNYYNEEQYNLPDD